MKNWSPTVAPEVEAGTYGNITGRSTVMVGELQHNGIPGPLLMTFPSFFKLSVTMVLEKLLQIEKLIYNCCYLISLYKIILGPKWRLKTNTEHKV